MTSDSTLQSITNSSKNIKMTLRGNKSKGKPTSRVSHFRTTDTISTHEREAPPASTLHPTFSDSDSDSDSDSSFESSSKLKSSLKAKLSKLEQFEAKTKKIAEGVGESNRKLTPKEKKCLMKERKKVKKMETKIRKSEEMAKTEQEQGEVEDK